MKYEDLATADLTVGRVYEGGPQPHVGADPLHRLTGVGNSGGFRLKSVKATGMPGLVVLFSTGAESQWPDQWTSEGTYIYYGDQRQANKDVLDTPRGGNRLLADVAIWMKRGPRGRAHIPPFLLFEKVRQTRGRDVCFAGLLVPAAREDWLTTRTHEDPNGLVTNYAAALTPLPVTTLTRDWLNDVISGAPREATAPSAWLRWLETGAAPTLHY